MAPVFFVDQDMQSPELHRVSGGAATAFSRRSPARGTVNEDAAVIVGAGDGACVLIVADGMGGAPGGDSAARLAVEALERNIARSRGEQSLRAFILDGIEEANRNIRELAIGAGATIALVEIRGNIARPYNVGDSIVLIFGGQGKIKYRTTEHSPTGYGIEAGLLNENEAIEHEERHILTNALGSQNMFIELGPEIHLSPRDTVLISSDGLTDNLYLEEICTIARKGPIEKASLKLARLAAERMGGSVDGVPSKPDDLTFIAFRPDGRKA